MSVTPNEQTALMALGVLQPANADEVWGFLKRAFPSAPIMPDAKDFEAFLGEQVVAGRVIQVAKAERSLYSLSHTGGLTLLPRVRRTRDKLRLYLLRDAHRRRISGSRADQAKELAGVSPAVDDRSLVKGGEANPVGLDASLGQPGWPRLARQFRETGSSPTARDTFPAYVSFRDVKQAAAAVGQSEDKFELDFLALGTCLGISPELVVQITRNPDRHYRSFYIPKAGGGNRLIESPRVFLKVIQWYLMDFVLWNLRVSNACFGFINGRSAVLNASCHVSSGFVGAIDIANFFGSVHTNAVEQLLRENNFPEVQAKLVSKICTKGDVLPQGAPTSPILSNAFLFEFDQNMLGEAQAVDAKYTRYADDITISGTSRRHVESLLSRAKDYLQRLHGLELNSSKTRIASRHGRQMVTGVVVNDEALPPREKRREIRAIFHSAEKNPGSYVQRAEELAGHIGYLNQFPTLKGGGTIAAYRSVLSQVVRKRDELLAAIGNSSNKKARAKKVRTMRPARRSKTKSKSRSLKKR